MPKTKFCDTALLNFDTFSNPIYAIFVLTYIQFFISKYNFMSFYRISFSILQTFYLLKLSNQHIMDTIHYNFL